MQSTEEQEYIKKSNEELIVKACAGSGKTTSFVEKAKFLQEKGEKALYLSFNKSIQQEAEKKFPQNTTCKTIHGLAYQSVGRKYKLSSYGLSVYDVKNILNIPDDPDYIGHKIAYIIKQLFNAFCGSDAKKVSEITIVNNFIDPDTVNLYYEYNDTIYKGAQRLWNLMDSGKLEITHDFYVKKYSFLKKDLQYDWVMVDEAQDISPCFIEIINSQSSKKIVCGDFSQAIYGWRYGVGDFSSYFPKAKKALLSNSFRFRQDIADLCNYIISLKDTYFCMSDDLSVTGKGNSNELKTKAVISRTNMGLLEKILAYTENIDNVYIEGGFKAMLSADGYSLYDVMSLYLDKKDRIKSEFIASFGNFQDLKDYVESVSANDLLYLIRMIDNYGVELINIIRDIKEKEVNAKCKAEIIFTTVHKSKGLEYDIVELGKDFKKEYLIKDASEEEDLSEAQILKFIEEINLLYVASSRAKNKLILPEDYFLKPQEEFLNESLEKEMSKFLNVASF